MKLWLTACGLIGAMLVGNLPDAAGARPDAFSAHAEALPFPPDAREVEFDATFDDIEYTSGSSLPALAAFYRSELPKRGWAEATSAAESDEESAEMTFNHDGAQVVIELDAGSDEVSVSMDCEGLDFSRTADPTALIAAGVPQPRAYVFLQKELPRPSNVQYQEYSGDSCHFKSTLALQAAFDLYGKALKEKGWRESRKPIITADRRYTEFIRGAHEVSVNIFADPVGSRIILGYLKITKDRVRGSLKMREPIEVFDDSMYVEVTIDAAILSPSTRIGPATAGGAK